MDLSSHNSTDSSYFYPWETNEYDGQALATFSERKWDEFGGDHNAFARQKQFINAVQNGWVHAEHVRKLHWTVLDTTGHFFGKREKVDSDNKSDEENEDLPLYIPEDGKNTEFT